MNIEQIIWLPEFQEKIESKHRISCEEVDEVFRARPRYKLIEKGRVPGENLYRAFGQTDDGRHLLVFFIYKSRGRALVISARDATERERKRYGKKEN
jgi:uncharacterized DUF497 family protein